MESGPVRQHDQTSRPTDTKNITSAVRYADDQEAQRTESPVIRQTKSRRLAKMTAQM